MYALTIDDHGHDLTLLYDSPQAARATLHAYLVAADYYHQPTQLGDRHSAYELLTLAQGRPRVVGVATIEPYSEIDARRDAKAALTAARPHAIAS